MYLLFSGSHSCVQHRHPHNQGLSHHPALRVCVRAGHNLQARVHPEQEHRGGVEEQAQVLDRELLGHGGYHGVQAYPIGDIQG